MHVCVCVCVCAYLHVFVHSVYCMCVHRCNGIIWECVHMCKEGHVCVCVSCVLSKLRVGPRGEV